MIDAQALGYAILVLLLLGFTCAVAGAWLIAGAGPALAVAATLFFAAAGLLMRPRANG